MKKLFTLLSILISCGLSSQSVDLDLAYNIGSTGTDAGVKVKYDASGNVYLLGTFSGTVDINYGAGVNNVVSAGGVDMFLCKYTSFGTFVWGFSIGNASGNNTSKDLQIDASGNVIISGYISGAAIDFDPGIGVKNLSTSGNAFWNSFVAKYDPSGALIFAHTIECSNKSNQLISSSVDQTGNIYIAGAFAGVTDFDPIGTFTISPTSTITALYFAKYSPTGALVYAKMIDNVSNNTSIYNSDISVNSSGELVFCGAFASTAMDLDPSASTYTLNSGSATCLGFIAKYDVNGDFQFGFNLEGFSNNTQMKAIDFDANGNIVVAGIFNLTIDLDPSPAVYSFTMTPSGAPDNFLAKYSATGSFIWGSKIGGSGGNDDVAELLVKNNFIYLSGSNAANTDFEASLATVNSNSAGSFVAKYDLDGSLFSVFSNPLSVISGIDVHNTNDDILITGYNSSSASDMDPTSNTYTIGTNGGSDAFIAQYSQMCAAPINVVNFTPNGNLTLCDNNVTSLMAASSGTVSWYSTLTSTTSIASGTVFTTPILTAGTYTFYAEGYTCTNSLNRTAITVTVNSAPVLTVTATNIIICVGEPTSISVSGANTYTWSNNANSATIIVTPSVTSNYTVNALAANGCAGTSSVQITVNTCTGIEEQLMSSSLLIYPNPNNGEFTIQSQTSDVVNIINDLGQVIHAIELTDKNNYSYKVTDLQNGIYFLVGKTVKQKIVVTK